MERVEGGETRIYTRQDSFSSRKRLYELLDQLGDGFLQIPRRRVFRGQQTVG